MSLPPPHWHKGTPTATNSNATHLQPGLLAHPVCGRQSKLVQKVRPPPLPRTCSQGCSHIQCVAATLGLSTHSSDSTSMPRSSSCAVVGHNPY